MRLFCSRCGAKLDRNQTICNYCGKILDRDPHKPAFYCRECYTPVGEKQEKCFHCGRKLGEPSPDMNTKQCERCGKKVRKLFDEGMCLQCAIKFGKKVPGRKNK